MDDLIAWLRGVLDEDERVAREAEDWHPSPWCYGIAAMKRDAICDKDGGEVLSFAHHYEPIKYAVAHIERFTPASVLADIAAKRAILDLHAITVEKHRRPPFNELTGEPQGPDFEVYCAMCSWVSDKPGTACRTVRVLASAYAHRPGYRDEWRP